MPISLLYRIHQRKSRILPEVRVSKDNLVQIISQIIRSLCANVSYAFIYGKERKLARVVAPGGSCAALDNCYSIKVGLLYQTCMCVDSVAHNYPFVFREHILKCLLEIWNCLLGAEWNVFLNIWKIFYQRAPRLLQDWGGFSTLICGFVWRTLSIADAMLNWQPLLLFYLLNFLVLFSFWVKRFDLFYLIKRFIVRFRHGFLFSLILSILFYFGNFSFVLLLLFMSSGVFKRFLSQSFP